jgi:AraC family transcriptional regulator
LNPVDKALWYIESRANATVCLDEIAAHAGVSKYYLLRAFAAATGLSIMRYVRARRLSEAAQQLAAGAPDILSVAIDCGYGSHEAFTRAFREQFGVTPETVRAGNRADNLQLVGAVATGNQRFVDLEAPRFEAGSLLLVAGINRYYSGIEAGSGVPAQWQQFEQYRGGVRGQVGQATYGVCYNIDDEGSMDYLCGIEVRSFTGLPDEFARLRLPPQRYVVFRHREHIAAIRATWNAIWNDWLPGSGHEAADAPLFERYDERYNTRTGEGGVELWVPLR